MSQVDVAAGGATLVHVGWPKTATTWLQDSLFVEAGGWRQAMDREQIIRELVLPDQIGFDATAVGVRVRERLVAARLAGLVPVISHERLCGVSHTHLESVVLAERLLATVPDLRVLMVVREQRDAMLSSWQQYVRNGGSPATGPSIRTLRTYFGDAAMRASVLPPPGRLEYFEYDRLLRWYVDALGADRVLALPLERLRSDRDGFVRRIQEFGGVTTREVPPAEASNTAWAPLTYTAKRWLNYVGDRREAREGRTAYTRVMRASYRLDKALPGPVRRLGADRDRRLVAELAGDHFAASNRRLAGLVDWDPAAYGYQI